MPEPRRPPTEAAEALVSVALLVSRWVERLLAGHEPSLTVAQFLGLRAIAAEGVSGSELARRAGVSGPAVSQLVAGLVDADLLARHELTSDRRRHSLVLTADGDRVLVSAQTLLRERLGTLLAGLPRPEADALALALPRVEAALSGEPPPRWPPHPPHELPPPRRR
ncbi:MAG: MarR family winged helix-turn-helix transcriptional regulator [Solirubrobacteraceae bacterium]